MKVNVSHDIGQALLTSVSLLESYDFHEFEFLATLCFVFSVCFRVELRIITSVEPC